MMDAMDAMDATDATDGTCEMTGDAGVAVSSGAAAHRTPRVDLVGTIVFAVALAITIPLRAERPVQIVFAAVSMVLFAIGAGTSLWAYVGALERSRTAEIGVGGLYLLTGTTAPRDIRRLMTSLLAVQVVLALTGAVVGVSGLSGTEVNVLAFGVLVPMFGIGMNGLWAVRHGAFGPRIDKATVPSNRVID